MSAINSLQKVPPGMSTWILAAVRTQNHPALAVGHYSAPIQPLA
jgi:hypothetical protein